MASMRGGALMATSVHSSFTEGPLFLNTRCQRQNSLHSRSPSRAAPVLRGGIKATAGFVTAAGLRSARPGLGFCGTGPSSAPQGSHFGPTLDSREGLRFGSSSKSRRDVNFVVRASKDGINAPERILAALGYILPFFDGIQYGRYFFLQYPVAEKLLRPLYPLLAAYKGFPYSNFIAFFSLYLLVVRNQSVSRYVRFNAMQAVVLDVLLILPTLVERTFAPRGGVGFELLVIFYNTVFLFLVACFLFGVVSCILGKTPRLPIVADAADAQV